jgi:hypothetical protein
MEKELILKNILKELDKIPLAYLKNIYQIIRTFRKQLPVLPQQSATSLAKKEEKPFNWDELIHDIHTNRRANNSRMAKNIDKLTW